MDRSDIGRTGEHCVSRWLRWRGYRVLAVNWRTRGGEIDIIALRFGTVHIIEVKTLRKPGDRAPGEAVGWAKRRRILKAASAWLGSAPCVWKRVEFGVAEVHLEGRPRVRHVRDAFRADEVAP